MPSPRGRSLQTARQTPSAGSLMRCWSWPLAETARSLGIRSSPTQLHRTSAPFNSPHFNLIGPLATIRRYWLSCAFSPFSLHVVT